MSAPSGLPFAKLHGAGNDFVLVDGRPLGSLPAGPEQIDWPSLARQACDRHLGIGADGLLVVDYPEPAVAAGSKGESVRYRMRMLNPDGSEAEMCGNGLRCFVRWLRDEGEIGPGQVAVQTGAGLLTALIDAAGDVIVNMGIPRLAPSDIPLARASLPTGPNSSRPVLRLPVDLSRAGDGSPSERSSPTLLHVTCVSMGNPHAVAFVCDVDEFPLEQLGPLMERHPLFPARTNFEVCQVVAPDRLRVRVWERGAGLTLACGSGACAALVAARLHGLASPRAQLALPGGALVAEWPGTAGDPAHSVLLGGPTARVFDGLWRAPLATTGTT